MALNFGNMFADWVYETEGWKKFEKEITADGSKIDSLEGNLNLRQDTFLGLIRDLDIYQNPDKAFSDYYYEVTQKKARRERRREETGKTEVVDASDAFKTDLPGMEKHYTKYIKGYPDKSGNWKFDNADDCLIAFRKAVKEGKNVGGITCQKVRKYLRWEIRAGGLLVVSKSKADSTCSWVPENWDEYKADCAGTTQSVEEPEPESESEDEDPDYGRLVDGTFGNFVDQGRSGIEEEEPEIDEEYYKEQSQEPVERVECIQQLNDDWEEEYYKEQSDDESDEEAEEIEADDFMLFDPENNNNIELNYIKSEGQYKNKILDPVTCELHDDYEEWEWDDSYKCPYGRLKYIGDEGEFKYWYCESGEKKNE